MSNAEKNPDVIPYLVNAKPEEGDPDALDARNGAEDEVEDDPAVDEIVQGKDDLGVDQDGIHWIRQSPVAHDVAVAGPKRVHSPVRGLEEQRYEHHCTQQGKDSTKNHLHIVMKVTVTLFMQIRIKKLLGKACSRV